MNEVIASGDSDNRAALPICGLCGRPARYIARSGSRARMCENDFCRIALQLPLESIASFIDRWERIS